MWCGQCSKEFPRDCTCADRDKRLAEISGMSHLAITYCSGCGEHATMCECEDPKPSREMRVQGRIIRTYPA